MSQPTHIIDPDGEVFIILLNSNSPFASTEDPRSSTECGIDSQPHDSDSSASTQGSNSPISPPAKRRIIGDQSDPRSSPGSGAPTESKQAAQGGSEKSPVFCIQVSAKHMMLASPVYKTMLTGGWKESTSYLETGAVRVTADSWDLEALLILLRLIHGQHYRVQRKLTLEMLAKVTVIADFYGCREILHIMADIWMAGLDEDIPAEYSRDSLLWVWITWFFQIPALFEQSTSRAMMASEGWINGWGLPIPKEVLDSMNKGRQAAVGELFYYLDKLSEKLLSRRRGCSFECSSIMYGALQMQMQSICLLSSKPECPYLGLSYRDTVEKVIRFRSPSWARHGENGPHTCFDSIMRTLIGDLRVRIKGLELSAELE